ncbi:MAG: hypothetical protein K2M60_01705, partial [Lachnospiraceae bacterium]|nr:hypothetical protein [Lachnospiraceae bacterium]
MVKGVKIIISIIKSNFAGWVTNYKIYISIILLLIFSLDNYRNVFDFASQQGYRVTPYLFPFLFTHPFMHLVIFSCTIFLFSNAPFVNSMQMLIMSRSGKRNWYVAQMIYILICSVCLTIFLLLIPIIANLNMIVLKNGWGKVITTLSVNNTIVNPISYSTISRYSADKAMAYSVSVSCTHL